MWDEITYPGQTSTLYAAFEVFEWISNFISHFTKRVIIDQCWNLSWSTLIKWLPFVNVDTITRLGWYTLQNIIPHVEYDVVENRRMVNTMLLKSTGWRIPVDFNNFVFDTMLKPNGYALQIECPVNAILTL